MNNPNTTAIAAHRMHATFYGGYYTATTEAFSKVVADYLPNTTENLQAIVGEITEIGYDGYNMAELLMVLADIETARMAMFNV